MQIMVFCIPILQAYAYTKLSNRQHYKSVRYFPYVCSVVSNQKKKQRGCSKRWQ